MYAFCNADDISWGTKNLDTKHADHDAKKMASKALAYQVQLAALSVFRGIYAGRATGKRDRHRCSSSTAAYSTILIVPVFCPDAMQVRPSKTSKAFWDAMSKVQNHLTDAKKIAAYNQKKEQKMRVRREADVVAVLAQRPT